MAKAPRALTGRVVAITGGGRGIGRATAAALVARGAKVAIGDIEADLATRTAAEIGALGLALDVTDPASFAAFLDTVEAQLGPLDVLVNNAGIMPIGPFVEETDATADRLIDINVSGVLVGSKLALRRMLPRGRGHLVNIASIAGKNGFPGGATYCATKHAVVGLSEAIRAEIRGAGVDVSIVMPTVVRTELGSGLPPTRGLPFVEPEDVAGAIVEALQSGRVDVYVPRALGPLTRSRALISRSMADLVLRLMRADRVLVAPDRAARAAYVARTSDEAATSAAGASSAERTPSTV